MKTFRVVSVIVGILLISQSAHAWKRYSARHIFDCNRAIVQEGRGGLAGVEAAYESLRDMVESKASWSQLTAIKERCDDLYDSLEPGEPVTRQAYYQRLNELIGGDAIEAPPLQKKLFVLMAGLRDNVAKCGKLHSSAMYAVIFGGGLESSAGICHNLEGDHYLSVAGGFGLSLGVGVNAAMFFDNQLGLYPEHAGSLGHLLGQVANTVIDRLFGDDDHSDTAAAWIDYLGFNIYFISSAGVGVVLPIAFLAEGIEDKTVVNSCIASLGYAIGSRRDEIELGEALEGFANCLRGASGLSIGAGINIALVFDLPVHFYIPFLRTNWLLWDIVDGDASVIDVALIKVRSDFMARGGF